MRTAAESAEFDALVRTYYGRLCNFAVRFVKDRDLVEDLVQDVFLRVWQRRTEFRHNDPLPYLYQAVRNRAANYAREQRVRTRWRERTENEARGAKPDRSQADVAEVKECADAIAQAIEALPDRCRQIFSMSREQDLTYAQIAKVLGISIKTVETQMGRALRSLRIRLADYLSLTAVLGAASRWMG